MHLLPLALLGIAAVYLFKGTNVASAAKQLRFSNPKIKINGLSWTGIRATVTMEVHNPTTEEIPVDYLSGSVAYKGKNLSNFQVDGKSTGLKIRPHGFTPVSFQLQINSFNSIATIFDIINNGIATVLQVNGSVYALGVTVPFNFSYDVVNQQVISNAISGKQAVNGIAGVEAKLQFSSNAEMEKYFSNKRAQKKIMFSKN